MAQNPWMREPIKRVEGFREEGDDVVMLVDCGIRGTPKFRIPKATILSWQPSEEASPAPVLPAFSEEIDGVTDDLEKKLHDIGVHTFADLLDAAYQNPARLLKVTGLGKGTLEKIKAHFGLEEEDEGTGNEQSDEAI